MRVGRGRLDEAIFRTALAFWPRSLRSEAAADLRPTFEARRSRGGGIRDLVQEGVDIAWSGVRARRAIAAGAGITSRPEGRMNGLVSIGRHAARSVRRSPGWALTTGGILCIGVAAATSVFAVADAVLLRALPYPEADRLVRIGVEREGRPGLSTMSGPNFRDLESATSTLASVSAFSPSTMGVGAGGEPSQLVRGGWVSGDFFRTLGVPAAEGRVLGPGDDDAGAPLAVVLGSALAARTFGGRSPVGRTIRLDGRSAAVVGVMGPGFHPPEGAGLGDTELWAPLALAPLPTRERGLSFLDGVGRIGDGQTGASVSAELASIGEGLIETHGLPRRAFAGLAQRPLRSETLEGADATLSLLLAAVAFLLGIAGLNAANLVLLRMVDRADALRVRMALGASRGRVIAESTFESVLVAGVGGLLGLGLATVAVDAVVAWNPVDLPRLAEASVDLRVAVVSGVTALAVGVAAGLVPATVASRRKGVGTVRSPGSSADRRTSLLRDGVVVVQVALGLALAGSAALVGRSLASYRGVSVGLDAEHLHVATLRIDGIGGDDFDPATLDALLASALAEPSVIDAGLGSGSPYVPGGMVGYLEPEGIEVSDEDRMRGRVEIHRVSADGLALLGIPLLRGRDLSSSDRGESEAVVVVSEAAARAWWDGEDPLGRRVVIGGDGTATPRRVVGVASDPRYRGPGLEAEEHIWIPWSQVPLAPLDLRVRVQAGADADQAIASAVRAVPGVSVRGVRSVSEELARRYVEPTFFALLFGAFAAAALAFSGAGLYATLSHTVRRRRGELGIRMALGADRERLIRGVIARAAAVTGLGLVLGGMVAAAGIRLAESFLFGVTSGDPGSWGFAVAVLLIVGLVAGGLPAWRAGATDPAASLRAD